MKTALEWLALYQSDEFKTNNYYDGDDLGAHCQPGLTKIKLWSPVAETVTVNFYKDGEPNTKPYWTSPMTRAQQGVWEWQIPETLHGTYYDFSITIDGVTTKTIDPYAKTAGVNGIRGMIIDMREVNPANWHADTPPEPTHETIITEAHVKEFSWDPSGGWPEDVRGKYKAFTIANTTLNGDGEVATGLDFSKWLGMTHIQLMPIYDYGSVDEEINDDQFNWGYDPVNYNVPEGSYATDAHRGEVRVRELKEAIQAIHKRGLRVIMDVVYNHTWNLDNALQRTMPYYFYRLNPDGSLSNGSGCGNDIACERSMVEKYIIDSVMYWAREYHIDGFRFDLMGLLTVDLMNKIRTKLDDKYGVGEKLIYGEPWAAAGTHTDYDVKLATKDNMGLLDINIGMFCDDTRDAIKGSAGNLHDPGFVNGGENLEWKIMRGVKAWCGEGSNIKAPSQIINYASAHDNQTLWDKLSETTPDEELRRRQNRLAVAIYMTCQGRDFMLSGSAFLRTKNGHPNSHNAPIEINRLNWSEIVTERPMVDYYRGLLHLRQELPGLYDKDKFAHTRIGNIWSKPGVVGFMVDNTDDVNSSTWEFLTIVYNRNHDACEVELAEGEWEILATGDDSWLWQSPDTITGNVTVAPVSWVMLGQKHQPEADNAEESIDINEENN
ncbi:MAG: type I pullulanase [Candidatus Saccharibacteria bacterium]|nr:type I pullulanase [Candidatus Saccharibacteria bacterium]